MEGLKIIEKSYNSLLKFKSSITDSSFSTASNLVIMMKNYDMKTQAGIKEAILAVLDVYKDDLGIQNTLKVVSGDKIELKFDKKVDGYKDDLVDSLKTYIDKRSPQLWNTITNSTTGGGLYGL